jgi:3-oxoacyl-[acyl-carrier protein] reductase
MNSSMQSLTSLEGKTAMVTGGSRGIGRSISLILARAGAFVVVNYRSDEDAARATVAEIEKENGQGTSIQFDVSDPAAGDQAIKGIIDEYGRLDILVNNAGISRDGLIGRMNDADWNQVVGTNLSGAFYLCRAASKGMIRNRQGRIINIASTAGEAGNPGQTNYSATKAGLIGLTKALARELAPRNVLVNAVSPGIIRGGMSDELDDEQVEAIRSHVPLRRMGTGEEVANAVLFLCSGMSDYITGQVIRVNGGLYV